MSNPFDLFPASAATDELKTKFAIASLKYPDEPFKAGLEVFGADTGRALYVAQNWINDAFVEQEKARLLQTKGARAFLPTKEEYAREVWKLAMAERTDPETKRHLMSLYGDIMGYKQQAEKPGINVTVNQQRVMVYKDHGSDEDWERKAAAHQYNLANGVTDVPSRTVQ